jgi:hypothetical protein
LLARHGESLRALQVGKGLGSFPTAKLGGKFKVEARGQEGENENCNVSTVIGESLSWGYFGDKQ